MEEDRNVTIFYKKGEDLKWKLEFAQLSLLSCNPYNDWWLINMNKYKYLLTYPLNTIGPLEVGCLQF